MPPKRAKKSIEAKTIEAVKLDRKYELASFWDDRYSKRKEKKEKEHECEDGCWHDGATDDFLANEWYFSYTDIKPLLQPFLRNASKGGNTMNLLDLGCGISTFFEEMAEDGFQGNWVGVDFSGEAVRQMRETYPATKYPSWDFVEADVRRMDTLASKSFDIIVDKALSDALICDVKQGKQALQRTYEEVNRLLRPLGVFVVVSLYSPEKEDDRWFLELLTESFLTEPKETVGEEKAPELIPVEEETPKKRLRKSTQAKSTPSSSSSNTTPTTTTTTPPSSSIPSFKLKIVIHSSSEDGEEENEGEDHPNWMSSRFVYIVQRCRATANSEPYTIEHKIH